MQELQIRMEQMEVYHEILASILIHRATNVNQNIFHDLSPSYKLARQNMKLQVLSIL